MFESCWRQVRDGAIVGKMTGFGLEIAVDGSIKVGKYVERNDNEPASIKSAKEMNVIWKGEKPEPLVGLLKKVDEDYGAEVKVDTK